MVFLLMYHFIFLSCYLGYSSTMINRIFAQCMDLPANSHNKIDSGNHNYGHYSEIVHKTESLLNDENKVSRMNYIRTPNFIYSEIYRCEVGSYFTKISRIVKTYANKTDCSLYAKSSSGYKIYDVMMEDDLGQIKIHVNYTVMASRGNETIVMTGQLTQSNFSACIGDLFVNKQINDITAGDCQTSIVQMESRVADIQILGNCQSYCKGKVLLM